MPAGTDSGWDDLLDAETELLVQDERYLYRKLGQINKIAESQLSTLNPDLQKPLLAIMAFAQAARERLIDG